MAKAKAQQDQNQNLPTLSDQEREIPEIQQAGASLLDVRTRRIALNAEEKSAQDLVIAAMKKTRPRLLLLPRLGGLLGGRKDKG